MKPVLLLPLMLVVFMVHWALTVQLFGHGDLHEQIDGISHQIEKDPKNAVLYHKRGELYRAHDDFEKALSDYSKAENLDPKLDVVFLSRGRTLFEAKQFEAANTALDIFLSRNSDHAEAHWLRARTLSKIGKWQAADDDFQRAIKLTAEPAPDHFIERSKNLQMNNQHEKALDVLEQGIKHLGPVIITLQLEALDQELFLKRYTAALVRLDQLLEYADRKESYLMRKAEIFETMGDHQKAQQLCHEVLRTIEGLPEQQRKHKAIVKLEAHARARLSN